MPRTGRRHSLTIAAALAAVLCAPAAAQAATYTVTAGAGGPCGAPADLLCGSLTEAAIPAAPGDIFNVTGTFAESPTFTVGGVTLAGAPLFTLNGSIAFTGNGGGVAKLQHAIISQQNGTDAAVIANGTASLEIDDSFVVSLYGDGVIFREGTANKIVRTTVATSGLATAAVHVTSPSGSTNTKKLTLESTLVTGGVAGVSVNTGSGNGLLEALSGDVDIVLRHVTAAGSTNGLNLDASQANPLTGGPYGNIDATVADSIIENGTAKANYPGLIAPPNVVDDHAPYTRTTVSPFNREATFQNPGARNFRLKAGSPAIDAGGFTVGESTTDIDGNPRPGPVTDLGADEYVAPVIVPPPPPPGSTTDGTPPVVKITKPTAKQRIALTKKTTKTTFKTVTRKGKKVKVKVKTTTSKRVKIGFAGTATDPSGIKGVLLAVQKLSTTVSKPTTAAKSSQTATTPTATKCKWLNGTKGIVLKSCSVPPLLLAKLGKDGAWTYNVKSTIKLGPGKYRIIAIGVDNSGAAGNTAAPADAVRTFTLTK